VFVRYGLFKDGKFKFKITFDNFPRRPPKVYFMSEVWHPMVDFETGLLDLG
jgi:ubiquitin-protein ligase